MAKLTVKPDKAAGATVLRLEGEVDAQNAPELERALESAKGGREPMIVVEMRSVGYIASAGWGVLLAAVSASAADSSFAERFQFTANLGPSHPIASPHRSP